MLTPSRFKASESDGNAAACQSLRSDSKGQPDSQNPIEACIESASQALLEQQNDAGYWDYQLEADCTIPAEYIMMMHFMDDIDRELELKIANYLRAKQADHGGWPLYHGGALDLSCSVKVYYALKLVGDDIDAPHMRRAREAILALGGAAQSNVFTRIALALFAQVPWRAVPFIPVEVMFLPKWFPFHLSKVSYWSRTVMVPLFILCSLKPVAANPRNTNIRELFTTAPDQEKNYFHPTTPLSRVLHVLDAIGRTCIEPLIPKFVRKRAVEKAKNWFIERLNGEDGLGAIFPAMVNAHESLKILGYDEQHPLMIQTRRALDKLLIIEEDHAYCQPCLSPMWDTGIASLALLESDPDANREAITHGLDWLADQQLSDEPGDWRDNNPDLAGGGWPFQFANAHYPDLDDTSMIGWAMALADRDHYAENIARAANWVAGMQSDNGGFGAFDRNNTHYYLNQIPFADHGALLDPPTEDVTARCIALLGLTKDARYDETLARAITYLKNTQQENGSWFGRWGSNYIYGTWSVLSALEVAGYDMQEGWIQKAAQWLLSNQYLDGGWGESNDSYYPGKETQPHVSTPFQTSWAMLGLIAAGHAKTDAVNRAANYLVHQQMDDTALWDDDNFTAPGFPRVFYLKYHGYTKFFPLWALAKYQRHFQKHA
ncbi:squalene--hopene cyclase-like [Artemia franciscana]|uniref:Terpene cyclase/mutase family member n=1 Tax=Artemia franciscana TaxID=6661 RepID=A0AA88KSX8_ARTSF|nr:hypothetical protein QYM36_019659 [Artemia franciscana]